MLMKLCQINLKLEDPYVILFTAGFTQAGIQQKAHARIRYFN